MRSSSDCGKRYAWVDEGFCEIAFTLALSRKRERGVIVALMRDSVTSLKRGPLAQLVEQETLNLLVVGSTPTRPTKFKDLRDWLGRGL